jgi:3-oxoacyl-[acyl-carrier protein] reductase
MSETDKQLKHRTVFVTGAAAGIGRAIALKFAREGWDVLCHYHSSAEGARSLKKEITELGRSCDLLQADLSSKKSLHRLLGKLGEFRIDSLVNNAGSYSASRFFPELTLDELASAFAVNTFAPILIASRLFLTMKEQGFGRIVNISSIAAKYGGSAQSLHYGCSKRALEGLTKTLAREGAAHNILVNTLRPGVIDTDFHRKFPKDMKKRIAMVPAKKMGRPEDVAELVHYLGSEKNVFITNETIAISGGE